MKYDVIYRDGAVCLPAAAFLACEDVKELKLLMLLSYDRALGDADAVTLAEQLGCTEAELTVTVASLREKGLLSPERKLTPSGASKNLSGEEMATAIDGNLQLKQLIEECQTICGKSFTPTEISKLVSLHTELKLDPEMILLLFFYHAEKLDALGRRVTVSYVEKSAYSLYNQEVRTTDAFHAYIRESEERNSRAFRLRRLFGMGDRAFTKKEQKFFDKWFVEWGLSFELVEHAFELTVDRTGKAGLEYISKILSDWHSSGITTVEQAEKASEDYRRAKAENPKFKETPEVPTSSFNAEEFFEKALKRSYAIMSGSVTESREGKE